MRKVLIALFAVMLIGGGSALAQDMDMGTNYWVGLSAGYPGAAFHFGVENLTPNLAGRFNLGVSYFGSAIELGADALYTLPVDMGTTPATVYVGGGPDIGIGWAGGFAAGLNVFVGGEYLLTQANMGNAGVFAEMGPAVRFAPGFGAGFVGRLGFNYHF